MIEVVDSGLVYRNPRPELRSRQTWHPTLVRFDDGEWLCTFDIAEADVATTTGRTALALDRRRQRPGPPPSASSPTRPAGPRRTRCASRACPAARTKLVAFGGLNYRDDPEGHLVNLPGLGYVEMDMFTLRSHDRGRTWEGPTIGRPAARRTRRGRSATRSSRLRDGRWIAPTSTWMGWNGDAPNGMNASGPRVRGQGPHVADVRHRVRPLGRGQDPLGAVGDPAARRAAAVGCVGGRQGHGRGRRRRRTRSAPDGRTFPVKGLTGFLRPDDQARRAARRPRPRGLSPQRRSRPLGHDRARIEGDAWVNDGDGAALAGRRVGHGRASGRAARSWRSSSSASRRWSCGRTAT